VREFYAASYKVLLTTHDNPKAYWVLATTFAVLNTVSVAAFQTFSPTALTGLGVALVADWILGMAAAWKSRRFSSEKAAAGIKKILLYAGTVAVVVLLDYVELGPVWQMFVGWFAAFVGAALVLTEAVSILEHIHALGGTTDMPLIGVFIKRLKKQLDAITDDANRPPALKP
jgi:toxin secretion/phage lysis holin